MKFYGSTCYPSDSLSKASVWNRPKSKVLAPNSAQCQKGIWKAEIQPLSVSVTLAQQPNAGQDRLILEVSRSHTMTQHSCYNSSGRVIGALQRPLTDATHNIHKKQTSMPTAWFEAATPAIADPRIKPLGHWDRRNYNSTYSWLTSALAVGGHIHAAAALETGSVFTPAVNRTQDLRSSSHLCTHRTGLAISAPK